MEASRGKGSKSSWAGSLLLLVGLAGCLAWSFEIGPAWTALSARSSTPLALNPIFYVPNLAPDQRLASAVPMEGCFRLEADDLFRLKRVESVGFRYNFVAFDLKLEAGDQQGIYFRGGKAGFYRLALSPDPSVRCGFSFNPAGSKDGDFLKSLGDGEGWRPSEGVWHHYKMVFSGQDFSLEVDRDRSFDFSHTGLGEGAFAFKTISGRPLLDNVALEGDEGGNLVQESEAFDSLSSGDGFAWLSHPVAAFFAALVLASLYALWFALPRGMAFKAAFRAILSLFFISIIVAVVKWKDLWQPPVWLPAAAPFILGLLWGLVRLPRLGMGGKKPGWARVRSLRGGKAALIVGVVVLAAGLAPAGFLLNSRLEWKVGEPAGEGAALLREEMVFEEVVHLDPSNAWIPSPEVRVRDFVLEGDIFLEPDSQAEVFFRRRAGIDRVCLQISTLPGLGCTWLDSTPIVFRQVHPDGFGPVEPGVWNRFQIDVIGPNLTGSIMGEPLPKWVEGKRAEGGLGILVNKGAGKVRDLRIQPVEVEVVSPPFSVLLREVLWFPLLLVAFWLVVALFATAGSPLTWGRYAVLDAFPHLPLALYPAFVLWGFKPAAICLIVLCAVVFLGRLAPLMANGRHIRKRAVVAVPLLLIVSLVWFYDVARELPSLTYRMNNLKLHDFDAPVLPEMAWYQMPKLRRSNEYHDDHRFRERYFSLTKPEGAFRIVCMGSSSTYGHGLPMHSGWDFPSAMEKELGRKVPGRKFEVINAGIRGCDSAVVRELYSGVIREFSPDLVLINLFYNDTFYQPIAREYDYMEKLKASAFRRNPIRRLGDRLRVIWNNYIYEQYNWPLQKGELIPERYETVFKEGAVSFRNLMEDTVARIQADGVKVLLVKEPFREGSRGKWARDTYYGILDEIGRENGVPVLSPLDFFSGSKIDLEEIFVDYIHLNRQGNQLMAEYLSSQILAQGLLDP